MPRIPREEHAAIRQRVDVEGQKVTEVAAAYGCTPANIYAILARLRRQGAQKVSDVVLSASGAEAGVTRHGARGRGGERSRRGHTSPAAGRAAGAAGRSATGAADL